MWHTRRGPGILDVALIIAIGAAIFWLAVRVFVTLDYNWKWDLIPRYLFRFDEVSGSWKSNYLVHGLVTTIRLSLWSGILALTIGLMIALGRCGRRLYFRLMAVSYIELLRNLPPLVIIFLFYFFLADQVIPLLDLDGRASNLRGWPAWLCTLCFGREGSLSAFLSAVLTLAFFEGAYFAEILRAGIESVERGQWEAAHALGLSRGQSLRHIILPQAFRRTLPPLAGQFISLIKDSAIVSVISIQDLTYQGTQLMASTYQTIEVWLTIALMYLLLTFPCSLLVRALETRYGNGQQPSASQ
ncbi:MAG: amino acid ABC transporter permease [Desulfobulbus propionicus]|nr:MAG: amino acid ABC transporter permease [Desulfobulbus propionicus]